MNRNLLQKYAELVVVSGVNVQKGQTLIINASINARDMVRACTKAAYEHGAKRVQVFYSDDELLKLDYEHQSIDTLTEIKPWQIDSKLDYLKEGACLLHIISETPGILKGLDAEKISKRGFAMANANKEAQEYPMSNKTQWCIAAVPNPSWATLVFPQLEEEEAIEKLWQQILSCVHVREDNDPIEEWRELNQNFAKRVDKLNACRFDRLHFVNQKGTDLYVKLVKHHIWAGGSDKTVGKGIEFNANMPTEEIFTTPDRCGVDGRVYASKPLDYNGNLVEDFWIEFQDGKVVDYDAAEGKDTLTNLIEFDEGSCRLGEVALVPYDSPISQSKILFYNTLFDENASCHLALGNCYASNIVGGVDLSDDELKAAGGNISLTHVDFMFGTEDMDVIGIYENGEEEVVFRQGNFVF